MLMRFAKVEKGGEFTKPPHDRIAYSTMVWVRASFVIHSFYYLARVVTIATRYSCVRRQGWLPGSDNNLPENKVLDYKTQQYRLFPLLSTAYCNFLFLIFNLFYIFNNFFLIFFIFFIQIYFFF